MEQQLNEMLDDLAIEVSQGLLLRNAKARLTRLCKSDEMVEKLTRVIEIRANELSHGVIA